jgi:hypothetical protein
MKMMLHPLMPQTRLGAVLALSLLGVAGCSAANPLPQPRPVVAVSGERVRADPEAMQAVDRWLRPQLDDIDRNPSYLIRLKEDRAAVYPWERLVINGDTVDISLQQGFEDGQTPFLLYAHFRLMAERGQLERWLPEGVGLEGLELERVILTRIADVWLYGRAVYDTSPYAPLDEIMYARENGFLDDLIFATQSERFGAEAIAFYATNPERLESFRVWFRRTFEREPPTRGVTESTAGGVPESTAGGAPGSPTGGGTESR